MRLIEVSLQRPSSADVQRHAMESTTQHLGVPKLKRDDIEAVLLQEPDQSGLVSIGHDQIGIDAEQIHIDPIAANALGKIVSIVPVRILHRRAVDDLPLLQDLGQSRVINPGWIAENQAGPQGRECRVNVAAEVDIFEEVNPESLAQDGLQPLPPSSFPVLLTR